MGVRRSVAGRRLRVAVLSGVLAGSALASAGPASAESELSLVAGVSHTQFEILPAPAAPGVDLSQSVSATDTQAGHQGWAFSLTNTTDGVPVTAPAITVGSGWAPADFPGLAQDTVACPDGDVTRSGTTFPVTWTDTLALPGQPGPPVVCDPNQMRVEDLSLDAFFSPTGEGNPPLAFQPGFDSFRSLDTTTVAPGGTQQMTAGITVRDPSYTQAQFRFFVLMTPETVTSITLPAGLPPCPPDPGTTTCLLVVGQSAQGAAVTINHPVPGTEYLFSATFTNDGPTPVDLVPAAQVAATRQTTTPVPLAGTSTQVAVPSLDGPTPGSGTVGFTVGPGEVADWSVAIEENSVVEYPGHQFASPYGPPDVGNFLIGDQNASPGSTVTFWGSQWAARNGLTGGPAPAAFKGFASTPSGTASCGAPWTSRPGNSARPPATVPEYMTVLVTSAVSRSGPVFSGTSTSLVVIRTDPGYAGAPGHAGTGTVVAVLPC
ncbi:hypothetical protein GCM10010531_40070 [Blastococcus jejuensis]|uniref:DUF11 domain-containing protein n=1 Tax=Blastococcus jejuensis TaxID=351224 RepID=A0ABP6PL43_9ACTN